MVVAFAMAFVAGSAVDAVACQDEGRPVGVAGDLHYVLVAEDSEPDPIHSAVETCAHGHCHHLGLGIVQGQDASAPRSSEPHSWALASLPPHFDPSGLERPPRA